MTRPDVVQGCTTLSQAGAAVAREVADGLRHRPGRDDRALGYPACPELEDRAELVELVELLGADRIGVQPTEEFQLVPEQSTDAIVVHHPEANYFAAK